jgi:aryl-alcohol dehydrogenase-like predicted oxidoreductase
METRRLGDMQVGITGLGLAQLGRDGDYAGAERLIHAALDAGINFFDTADIYGHSAAGPYYSEEFLGRALGSRRSKVHISTKFGYSTDPVPGTYPKFHGLDAAYAEQAVDASLKRLRTDYIDLYQPHTADPNVPIEETLGALARLVEKGKVRYIGSSRFTVEQIVAADTVARTRKWPRFISTQAGFNLLQRAPLAELIPTLDHLDIGLIPFSPLASGFLTGKYRENRPLPPGSALAKAPPQLGGRMLNHQNFQILEALDAFAQSNGHTILELAFCWLAAQPRVKSVIAGARNPEQVQQNAKAAEWKLSVDDLHQIHTIVRSFDASERTEKSL